MLISWIYENSHENFIPEFLSSIAIQCSTSVICEKFIQEAAKFTNSQKFSPSKILGYTVLVLVHQEYVELQLMKVERDMFYPDAIRPFKPSL